MTFPETITPSTATETAAQPCDGDPFGLADLPSFLRRSPQPTKPAGAGEAMRSTPGQEPRS